MNEWCFRPRFYTTRLYWVGDNLSKLDEIYYESCSWCRIDHSTCWPAVQFVTTVLLTATTYSFEMLNVNFFKADEICINYWHITITFFFQPGGTFKPLQPSHGIEAEYTAHKQKRYIYSSLHMIIKLKYFATPGCVHQHKTSCTWLGHNFPMNCQTTRTSRCQNQILLPHL